MSNLTSSKTANASLQIVPPPPPLPDSYVTLASATVAVIGVVGLFAFFSNALVLYIILRGKLLKKNVTFWFLFGLAGADMFLGVGVGLHTLRKLSSTMFPSVIAKKIVLECAFYDFCYFFGMGLQTPVTLFIGMDRMYAVLFPMKFMDNERKYVKYVVAAASITVATATLAGTSLNPNYFLVDNSNPVTGCGIPLFYKLYLNQTVTYLCFITAGVYVAILIAANFRRGGNIIQVEHASIAAAQLARLRRMNRILAALLAIYVATVASSNLGIFVVSRVSLPDGVVGNIIRDAVGKYTLLFEMVSTVANIFIYPWKNEEFREEFEKFCGKLGLLKFLESIREGSKVSSSIKGIVHVHGRASNGTSKTNHC